MKNKVEEAKKTAKICNIISLVVGIVFCIFSIILWIFHVDINATKNQVWVGIVDGLFWAAMIISMSERKGAENYIKGYEDGCKDSQDARKLSK